ncbi:type II secretion system protein N [Salinivibrio kushneri]|uniref:type II secretion system protein N n=1 Tax=Salinivibrio kushneri TaxID=1908198 RepID=UPI000C84C08A|nr:type II secretion system protein N [Salinivibrio kushneri]
MAKKVLIGVGCLLVFIVSAIVHAPATLLRLAPLPAELQLSGIHGTVWQGQIRQVRWQDQAVGPVQWDLHWHRLLTRATLETAIKVKGPQGLSGKGVVGFNGTELTLSQTLLSAPAHLLTRSVALPPSVSIDGRLDVIVREAVLAESGCQQLAGQIQWQQAGLTLPSGRLNDIPLRASLACDGQGVAARGQGDSPSLSNKFSLSITPSGRYSVSGWLKPGPAYPEPMKAPLSWLGAPDNQGRYRFSFRG